MRRTAAAAAIAAFVTFVDVSVSSAAISICGDSTLDFRVTIADALQTLRAAGGAAGCDPCLCDLDGDRRIAAGDALCALQLAVGLSCSRYCEPCGESICGDGEIPPRTGDLLGTSVNIGNCLLLDVGSDYTDDIEVTVLKTLDADLEFVDGATVEVVNFGCDCFPFASARPKAEAPQAFDTDSSALAATTTSSTTSSSMYVACNCYVGVYVEAPESLAVVEALIEIADGDCDDFFYSEKEVRLTAGLEEECDDGNAIPNDGCSRRCLREVDGLCDEHEDCAADQFCDGYRVLGTCKTGCRDNADCPQGQFCFSGRCR